LKVSVLYKMKQVFTFSIPKCLVSPFYNDFYFVSSFYFEFFWQCWGYTPEPWAYQASVLPLSYTPSHSALCFVIMLSLCSLSSAQTSFQVTLCSFPKLLHFHLLYFGPAIFWLEFFSVI
jgi:hypothetical protein